MEATLGSSWWSDLASRLLTERQQERGGTKPSKSILLEELKMCTRTRDVDKGKRIHAEAVESGGDCCLYVATALIKMYSKCGNMAEARKVFDCIKQPDLVSWTLLILGYAENGNGATALELFQRVKSQGYTPNCITFVAALKACASLALEQEEGGRAECLEQGRRIHAEISCPMNIYLHNTLVGMYSRCGSMPEARQVFDSIGKPDVVSWSALILGYAENGEGLTALHLFARMRSQGCAPNLFTLVAALKACTSIALAQGGSGGADCLSMGRRVHSEVGTHADVYVQSALIDMYSKCGSMSEARRVFDGIRKPDVVSWTALILGYAEKGEGVTALNLFAAMRSQGCAPNSFTFVAALKACSLLGALEPGCKIHGEIRELNVILVTSLVDFYAKCGCLVEARTVFDSHPGMRNLRTWNALLAGYSHLGCSHAVFELFEEMQDAGVRPDGVSFVCVLACCSHCGLLGRANELFDSMSTKYGITPCVEHYTCMVDILGRLNKLEDALRLLQSMPCRPNAVTWMTLLAACRKWKNAEIGEVAFRCLVNLGGSSAAAAYVEMAKIYQTRGMLQEQEMVPATTSRPSWPAHSCWTNGAAQVHTFYAGDSDEETW